MLRAVRHAVLVDRAFDRSAGPLNEADRRLAHELTYGVLRLRGRLDHLLEPLVKGGIRKLDPDVLDILRLGAYQLLELDRVPDYAAVNDSVEAAKASGGRGAASLVNAVLRRVSRERSALRPFPGPEDDPVGYLVTWGSHPRWMIERWLARAPLDEVERLVAYDNSRPAIYLSVVAPREQAMERLRAAGMTAEPVELVPDSLRLESSDLPRALDLVRAVVQDPAAASVVDYMALDREGPVIDLCAAPGGKATLLAARGYEVWAFDVSRPRLGRLLENRERLDLKLLHVALADSTRPPVSGVEVVLLDAPCTGTGTLARHPDGRWRIEASDIELAVESQRRLLDAAAEVVAPGGLLVYATCSLEPEENEEQVEAFLERHEDYGLEPPKDGSVASELLGPTGELRVLPQSHGMDGAYAARLRRRAR